MRKAPVIQSRRRIPAHTNEESARVQGNVSCAPCKGRSIRNARTQARKHKTQETESAPRTLERVVAPLGANRGEGLMGRALIRYAWSEREAWVS